MSTRFTDRPLRPGYPLPNGALSAEEDMLLRCDEDTRDNYPDQRETECLCGWFGLRDAFRSFHHCQYV